ncbi:flagellar biosynthesis anti-sigma factor FlgM [Halochromatium roseum]|uniref:flagellar biosynthesis anti-sigma factor FlgM n=1 Tax=Halochromatium roseum TaxID=391920 RepID=UPI0019131CE0|nr:flagellar biosynthesis anti-sigma factor FlgM [Halochromatium roseum]MBK5939756.1 flagellar biosynthesis anti-sigma factor FlgM [Halochromatium roseum]
MKIDSHHPLFRASQPAQEQSAKVQGPVRSDTSKTTDPAVQTHLHREAAATDQDINVANVEAIRDAIRDGRLEVRADRIADGLIASVRDLLEV